MLGAALFGGGSIDVDDAADELQAHREHRGVVPMGLYSLAAREGSISDAVHNMRSASVAGDPGGRDASSSQIGSVYIVMPALNEPHQPVAKEGFLNKIGDVRKNWKSRYFRLLPGRLVYYKDGEEGSGGEVGTNRLGAILLPQATLAVFASDVHPAHPYCFGITPADQERQYVLECDSEAHRAEWLAALQAPIRQRMRAVGNSVREGYLVKQGGTVKNWKRRYCVLSESSLRYFPSHEELGSELGVLQLTGGFGVAADNDEIAIAAHLGTDAAAAFAATTAAAAASSSSSSAHAPASAPYGFVLRLPGSERVWHFKTNTRQDREEWLRTLQDIRKKSVGNITIQ